MIIRARTYTEEDNNIRLKRLERQERNVINIFT